VKQPCNWGTPPTFIRILASKVRNPGVYWRPGAYQNTGLELPAFIRPNVIFFQKRPMFPVYDNLTIQVNSQRRVGDLWGKGKGKRYCIGLAVNGSIFCQAAVTWT